MDFQYYIVSSTPPLTTFYHFDSDNQQTTFNNSGSGSLLSSKSVSKRYFDGTVYKTGCRRCSGRQTYVDVSSYCSTCVWQHEYPTLKSSSWNCNSNFKSGNPVGVRRKVSFADEQGLALTTVRIIYNFASELPQMTSKRTLSLQYNQQSNTPRSAFKLNFIPLSPWSREYTQKLEQNVVMLDQATVERDTVLGNIRVKNIAYEKKVTVRHTFNNWLTYSDFDAVYVPPPVSLGQHLDVEDFIFRFQIPTQCSPITKMRFAICYKTPDGVFWDNNGGVDYEIVE